MRMVLIDVYKTKEAKEVDIENTLEAYYKALDCECIDIVSRKVAGQRFDIICDDEGLFREGVLPSACDSKMRPVLAGNLLICKHDGAGNELGLTEEEAKFVLSNVMWSFAHLNGLFGLFPVLNNVEF